MDSKRLAEFPLGMAAACMVACAVASFAPSSLLASTAVEDGFTSVLLPDGDAAKPGNSVATVRQGTDVYYWVRWKDHAPGHASLRCLITDGPGGEALVDETQTADDSDAEGLTFCGLDTTGDFEPGTYYFAQYLDDEKIGERSIEVESRFTQKMTLRREIRYGVGLLALAILGIGWVQKKRGQRGKAALPVAIGTRVNAPAPMAAAPAPRDDAAEELRKCGLQYQSLLAQADKKPALEVGRRYLGLLLKARKEPEALEVFKACVALDAGFRPERAEDVLPLAKAARASGDAQSAVACLRGFDKVYPGSPLIPEVYVFSARLMAEDLRNPEMARKILEHVVQKYPGHYVAQEAKKYLQSMPAA